MLIRHKSTFKFFLGCVFIALVMCFMPTRWIGWENDVADIVSVPTVPFGHVGTTVKVWLRGNPEDLPGGVEEVQHLRAELDGFRSRYNDAKRRVESLEDQIEQLQRSKVEGLDVQFNPQAANIVGRNTASAGETYSLNVGENKSIEKGSVAVYDGSHLIGKISSVFRITSTLIPITDPAIDLLEAFLAPASANDSRMDRRRARTALTAVGDGTLTGEVRRDAQAMVGDYLLLDDPTWPRTARAMIVGVVVAVQPKEDNPYLDLIIVRPRYSASKLAYVTIKVERFGDERLSMVGDDS